MPLVERYNDWSITDGSFDDPHTLEFDHRIEADAASSGSALANIEDNVKATCVITILKPGFGWIQAGADWIYDPTHTETNLESIWRNNLADCVQYDKDSLKSCFCNSITNPAGVDVGPEAEALFDKIDTLEWPRGATEFVSRFAPAEQYMIGPKFCSAYHLGDGYVGTAGHCLDKALVNSQLGELRVVFNWVGDVVSKKTFTKSEIFEIERVALCDTHGPTPPPANPDKTARWTRRWDSAVLKLKGASEHFSHLKAARLTARPPEFGSLVYNIGSPLGTQLKVSVGGHVLRHSLVGNDASHFSHVIAGYGTYTTDLDQFEGNSGGPVFDAKTGLVVGHTSSTQDAVFESDASAIAAWAEEFAKPSKNYKIATEINAILKKQEPDNAFYRIHPKFLRTLTGKPRESPLIKCATNICPGDLAPNKQPQTAGKDQAVFSRHRFDSEDVYLRNATARVDRGAIFLTPLRALIDDHASCLLTIKSAGETGAFRKPHPGSTLLLKIGPADWALRGLPFRKDATSALRPGLHAWSATLDLSARRADVPQSCLDAPFGLAAWSAVRLGQPTRNAPSVLALTLSVRRSSFPFAAHGLNRPPGRAGVTRGTEEEAGLRWPGETFEFATTAGDGAGAAQTDGVPTTFEEGIFGRGLWMWGAPIERVWTDPRQPSFGLRDPLADDVDELLA